MRAVLSLLHLQLDNKTNLLKPAKPKKMAKSIGKIALLLAILISVAIYSAYSIFKTGIGMTVHVELFSIVLMVTQLISLVFAIGTIINTLYLSEDNEMLICLPVTPNQLFISKLLFIYVKEFAVNAAMCIPVFIAFGVSFIKKGLIEGAAGSIDFYFSIPVFLLLLPILPIVVGAFLSLPIMWIIRFLKKHPVLSIVTVFSLLAVALYGYITLLAGFASEFDIANNQFDTSYETNMAIRAIGSKIPVYFQLSQAAWSFDKWYYFPIFLHICLAVSFAAIIFTRHFFFKVAMSSLENTVKVKKKVKPFRKRGRFASLLLKEILCVFRSSSEVFEYFLFTILMPFIVYSYDRLLMSAKVGSYGMELTAGAHLMVVAIMAMLSNISSASAISRDGGNFHMSKIIPVNYFEQIFAKFTFNAIFTTLALLVTAVISLFYYSWWQVLLGTLAVIMAAVGHIALCIDCDIRKPTINFQGNADASVASRSTPKCLAHGLIIGFLMGITVMLMSVLEGSVLPYVVVCGAAFVFMVYRVVVLVLRINLAYDRIEM